MEDEIYMRRCLQLAQNGKQLAKPNPMVGAVIVSHGRIIGEGYHVRCGEGHAEVNAFAHVRPEDEPLLGEATLYVSLEPCSHHGKTPPCADLIVRKGVKRCVIGCVDPFAKVHGRGIQRLREAGIAVTVGVLEAECRALNRRFITCNTEHRPYLILKWAQTQNGILGDASGQPLPLSTPVTRRLVHQLRAECDAILVGHTTFSIDHPQLNTRYWSGASPQRIVLSRTLAAQNATLPGWRVAGNIDELLAQLHAEHCQSLLVEGGTATLNSFLARGLWDEVRIETAPILIKGGTPAPAMPTDFCSEQHQIIDGNTITTLCKSFSLQPKS